MFFINFEKISFRKLEVLIIAKVWPEPKSSAAGTRMLQLISTLQKLGEVHVACTAGSTGNEVDLAELAVHTHTIKLNDDAVNTFFLKLNPELVIFDRFMTEEQFGWRIMECCPNAIRILNTEDVHFLRKTRHQFLKQNDVFSTKNEVLDFYHETTFRELAAIYRCDCSLIISDFEMQFLPEEFQIPKHLLHYLPLFSKPINVVKTINSKTDLVFVGNFLHAPNLDAVRYLLQSGLWDEIHQQIPQATLKIAGAYPTAWLLSQHNPKKGVEVLGHLNDVEELYKNAKLSIIPLRFGAGIKGKVLEAMAHQIPFIATDIAVEGLFFGASWENYIAKNRGEFISKCVNLYQQVSLQSQFKELSKIQLQTYFQQEKYQSGFLDLIQSLKNNLAEHRKKSYTAQVLQHQSMMSSKYLSKWIMAKNDK